MPARSREAAGRRSALRARRRLRQHRARPVDVHGRNAGDGEYPALRDLAQPGDPRRDRPGHGDLRWAQPRVGGGRVSRRRIRARGRRRSSRRTITSSPTSPTRSPASPTSTSSSASGRRTSSFCGRWCPGVPTAATASRWRGSPACRPRWCSRAREILNGLERDELSRGGRPSLSGSADEQQQLGLFQALPHGDDPLHAGCARST